MSQRYEMICILRPDLPEEQVQQEINKYRDFLNESRAEELQIKIWGKRRLAYPIKKYLDGIYVQMNYKADGKQVAPLERAMRLSDEVIRYLTLKLPAQPPIPPQSQAEESVPEVAAPMPRSHAEVAAPRSYGVES